MRRDDDRTRKEFVSEAEELLDAVGADLAQFEEQGEAVKPALVNKIFREVHSLKGLAGMLGFAAVSDLSHSLEDMLDKLRMGKIKVGRPLLDLLFDSLELLNRLIAAISQGSNGDDEGNTVKGLSRRIHELVSRKEEAPVADLLAGLDIDEQTRRSLTEYEEHRLRENVTSGNSILSVSMGFDFSNFDTELKAITDRLTEQGEVISTLPSMSGVGEGIFFRLLYGTRLSKAAVAEILEREAVIADLRQPVVDAAERLQHVESVLEETQEGEASLKSISQTVRVDIDKLDGVMNIVGELILEKSSLEYLQRELQGERGLSRYAKELAKINRNLDRKLNDLQKGIIEVRMVPIGQIYNKLARAVRKIAKDFGKEIELELRGETTELDKMMMEELTDPLLHLIRNALDHGIELPEKRVAAGKPRAGAIVLDAYQKGNSVVLDIHDDGRGLDTEAIAAQARKKNLIAEDEVLDREKMLSLIFAPGFSTATVVSEISGRGVGLDVVKKNIIELKGTIDVDSEPGQGTTFTISLPITLAIIQALVVRSAGETFAIPLTAVTESLRISASEVQTVERREVYYLRDTTLPLIRLERAFALADGEERQKYFVVVVKTGERRVGIIVDRLVKQQEIVIKAIGDRLKGQPGIAGATELGENELVLVVDVGSLVDQAYAAGRLRARLHAGGA